VGRLVQGSDGDRVWRIEANIDDMSPELCEHAAARAFAAGALDVWWTPVVMKKSRPALEVSALADQASRDAVVAALLCETTTIGVRMHAVSRQVLDRRVVEVETEFGRLPVKLAMVPTTGEAMSKAMSKDRVVNAAPEYEPCRRVAEEQGVPLKQVYAAVMAAYEHSRGRR
jgi:pyridinium-3,5-bisthiocarboxylic acid mononucleotide nickel chelatase